MNERLTDNEFHSKEQKERACYIQEPRLQAIYDKCFEYEDIDTNPTRLANIKKAFEIIANKKVNVSMLFLVFRGIHNLETLNKSRLKKDKLTEEECDLLKEVLINEEES